VRIFLAGASGVLGSRIVPMLIADGHQVAAMTRSPEKVEQLRALGADPVLCDVFDAQKLEAEVAKYVPEMVMHQVTDLPDEQDRLGEFGARNDRIRTEGTGNLIAAAQAADAGRILAQSIAWRPPGREEAVEALERQVLDVNGVVLRYGQLYGLGTFYEQEVPDHPRIQVDEAAKATVANLHAPPGILVLAEDAGPRGS
jgi:NAD(P)-dependent dehydrogenase (short-subunit alcohol dehydrogenase family)